MNLLLLGILTIAAAGILNGTFAFPMKLVKHWNWENIWFLFAVFGLVLLPAAVAFNTIDGLLQIYRSVPPSSLLVALFLGLGWGLGSLLFGLGISALGFSLGYMIVMGTTAIFGTIIPAMLSGYGLLVSARGARLLGSLVMISLGLCLCGVAGRVRELTKAAVERYRILTQTHFSKGVLICLASGILSACFNIGFALTTGISAAAERSGATPGNSSFSVWVLIMSAGAVPSMSYCAVLLWKKKSYRLFRVGGRNWFYAAVMALMWVLTLQLYGDGTNSLGLYGATVGWPVMMASAIVGANVLGIAGGEWSEMPKRVRTWLYTGIASLMIAVVLAGLAGSA